MNADTDTKSTVTSSKNIFTPPVTVALTGLLTLGLTAPFMTPYMLVATLNLFVLLVGFTLRKFNRNLHAGFMTVGILSDLALVLVLQFQRQAIQTAVSFKLSTLNQAHIFCSTAATALYIPMLAVGVYLWVKPKGSELQKKNIHAKLGWVTLIFRTTGFFLMFSMLKPHP